MKFCANCGTQMSDEICICPQCKYSFDNNPTQATTTQQNISPKKCKSQSKKIKPIKWYIIIPIVIIAAIAFFVIFFILSNSNLSSHNHDWIAATCVEPAQCWSCDEYKDDKLANHHEWHTYENGLTKCKNCGILREDWLLEQGVEQSNNTSVENQSSDKTTSLETNIPKIESKSFNCNDAEFIEWLEDFTNLKIGSKQDLNSDMNTGYLITSSSTNETGAIIFNHGSNGLNGDICGIMMYFDDNETSILLLSMIGEKINSDFIGTDAYNSLIQNKQYIKASMTMMNLDIDNMNAVLLAPTEVIADIIS